MGCLEVEDDEPCAVEGLLGVSVWLDGESLLRSDAPALELVEGAFEDFSVYR